VAGLLSVFVGHGGLGVVDRLRELLVRLDGPRFLSYDDRDAAVAELRGMGAALHPALAEVLRGPVPFERCLAGNAARFAGLDGWQGVVLALLADPDQSVWWYGCGLLYDAGDERAVPALVDRLRSDPDPGVRTIAADALGRIGSPVAVPALELAVERDHETDPLGFTPAGQAREALAAIREGRGRSAEPGAAADGGGM
jgi:HEAT repeat protein